MGTRQSVRRIASFTEAVVVFFSNKHGHTTCKFLFRTLIGTARRCVQNITAPFHPLEPFGEIRNLCNLVCVVHHPQVAQQVLKVSDSCQESRSYFPLFISLLPDLFVITRLVYISHADVVVDSSLAARDSFFTFNLLLSSLAGKYLCILSLNTPC